MKTNILFASRAATAAKALAPELVHAEPQPEACAGEGSEGYWEEAMAVSQGTGDAESAGMFRSATLY